MSTRKINITFEILDNELIVNNFKETINSIFKNANIKINENDNTN